MDRRKWMTLSATAAASSAIVTPTLARNAVPQQEKGIRYALNMSTIRGHKLPIDQQVDVAGKAGYDGIEPWIGDIKKYMESGGKLKDLAKRIKDHGMTVDSGIGFAHWIVDDDDKRKQGLENARVDMDLLAQIGGTHIAAPPAGANRSEKINLLAAAERYHALLEIGDQAGVIPMVEVWGFSNNLSRLGESMFVVLECGHPKACLLPDFYHLYKGGSPFDGLYNLGRRCIPVMHMNDYPDIPRDTINDSDRVYPGDGVCPLPTIIREMARSGIEPVYSLELFNKEYWKRPVDEVARSGLKKMKQTVSQALQN